MVRSEQDITDDTLDMAARLIGLDSSTIEDFIQEYTNMDEKNAAEFVELQKRVYQMAFQNKPTTPGKKDLTRQEAFDAYIF